MSLESPLCLVITAMSPTSLSSSIHVLHEIEDDNILEESKVGDGVLGSSSQDKDELSRSRSDTPAPEQHRGNHKRKRGSDKSGRFN